MLLPTTKFIDETIIEIKYAKAQLQNVYKIQYSNVIITRNEFQRTGETTDNNSLCLAINYDL